jgi:hypothetical protein
MEGQIQFSDLMAEAHLAALALDDLQSGESCGAEPGALCEGSRVYSQLADYRKTRGMTLAQLCVLETALEVLRTRLEHFAAAPGVRSEGKREPLDHVPAE